MRKKVTRALTCALTYAASAVFLIWAFVALYILVGPWLMVALYAELEAKGRPKPKEAA